MQEPSEWMIVGIRASLAFANDDEDLKFILNTCSWNKGTYFSLEKLSHRRKELHRRLLKIVSDPIKYLSPLKMKTLKEYIENNKEAFQTCYWKNTISQVIIWMYEIIKQSIKFTEYLYEKYPETCVARDIYMTAGAILKQFTNMGTKKECMVNQIIKYDDRRQSHTRVPKRYLPKIKVNEPL